MNSRNDVITLKELLTTLYKYKIQVVLVFIIGLLLVSLYVSKLVPKYEAKSTFLIKLGQGNLYRPEVENSGANRIPFNPIEIINTEIQILQSEDLIEKVIKDLTIAKLYPNLLKSVANKQGNSSIFKSKTTQKTSPNSIRRDPLKAAIKRFRGALSAESIPDSHVIEVTFKHTDPQIPAAATNLLVDYFKEKHLEVFKDPTFSFMIEQLNINKNKMEKSEKELASFKEKHGITSFVSQREILLDQKKDFETNCLLSQNQVEELGQKLDFLREKLRTIPKEISVHTDTRRNVVIDNLQGRLIELRLQEQDLRKKYKEDAPQIVGIRSQIEMINEYQTELHENNTEMVRMGRNDLYFDLEREKIAVEAQRSSLNSKCSMMLGQLEEFSTKIKTLDVNGTELRRLERNLEVDESNYEIYRKKVEEARISDEMAQQKLASISVIQYAKAPEGPSGPNKNAFLLLGALAALFFALGLAFCLDYADREFLTPQGNPSGNGLTPSHNALPPTSLNYSQEKSSPNVNLNKPVSHSDQSVADKQILYQNQVKEIYDFIKNKSAPTPEPIGKDLYNYAQQQTYVRLVLMGPDSRPWGNQDYTLTIDGKNYYGRTDGNGLVEQEVSTNATNGELKVQFDNNGNNGNMEEWVWPLQINPNPLATKKSRTINRRNGTKDQNLKNRLRNYLLENCVNKWM